jgi:hypothetical protein
MGGLYGVAVALAVHIRSDIIKLTLIIGRNIKRARTGYEMRKQEWFTSIFVLILASTAANLTR